MKSYRILIDTKTAKFWILSEFGDMNYCKTCIEAVNEYEKTGGNSSIFDITEMTTFFGYVRKKDSSFTKKKDAVKMLNHINVMAAFQQGGNKYLSGSLGQVINN